MSRSWMFHILFLSLSFVVVVSFAVSSTPATGEVGRASTPLSHNDRLWSQSTIPVCWENASPSNQNGRAWTKDAIEKTWEIVSNLDFTGWGSCRSTSSGIRIKIDDEGPHTKGLGRVLAGKRNGMVLNFRFREWNADSSCSTTQREFCIRAIAVHEFGHALGFSHEHNRNDRSMCTREPQGTNPTFFVTAYDPSSVMNYCSRNWNNNGTLSPLDVAGVRSIYGPFTVETPAIVSFQGTMHIVDGEVLRNETGSRDFNGTFRLTRSNPTVEQRFSHCVGGEVRVELLVKATILSGTAIVAINSTASMYEGSSCSSDEHEDDDHTVDQLDLGTLTASTRLRLLNSAAVGSDDMATININYSRENSATSGSASGSSCSSCVSDSDNSRFAPKQTVAAYRHWRDTAIIHYDQLMVSTTNACTKFTQDRIAWNYKGDKHWTPEMLAQLCKGSGKSAEPSRCFDWVMHKGIDWGGGIKWQWQNAIALCTGTKNAKTRVSCFEQAIRNGVKWSVATKKCRS